MQLKIQDLSYLIIQIYFFNETLWSISKCSEAWCWSGCSFFMLNYTNPNSCSMENITESVSTVFISLTIQTSMSVLCIYPKLLFLPCLNQPVACFSF